MPRLLAILCCLLAFATPPRATAAEAAAPDPWLVSLNAQLATRYRTTGDLRLSWNRARPASAPADAELVIVSAPAELAPQLLVTVRAKSPSGQESEYTLILRAELWRDGWTLREPAVIATPLNSTALDTRRYDALRERDALFSESLAELDFARSVPAGRLLTWRDVVRRPLVRRGQAVDVVATDGNLTVTLRAIALDDAARGESVRVRNPDSKKDFVAIVIAEARASVRF
ncbi:MAG: flagellar basal body P-ring formation chaperone FlgA [Opitutaceae bacterium]|jgi:flagella basal body P-ring formation protein FlgA